MPTKDIPYAYRRDIPFDLEIDENGDLKMAEDIDAVNQSIYSILVSNMGDKPLEPLFGSNMEDLIFDPGLPLNIMEFEIKSRLSSSIARLEPSIVTLGIVIDTSELTNHIIRIQVYYALKDGITTGVFDESLSIEDLKR